MTNQEAIKKANDILKEFKPLDDVMVVITNKDNETDSGIIVEAGEGKDPNFQVRVLKMGNKFKEEYGNKIDVNSILFVNPQYLEFFSFKQMRFAVIRNIHAIYGTKI